LAKTNSQTSITLNPIKTRLSSFWVFDQKLIATLTFIKNAISRCWPNIEIFDFGTSQKFMKIFINLTSSIFSWTFLTLKNRKLRFQGNTFEIAFLIKIYGKTKAPGVFWI
jgi:uncharacterized protein YjaG (DUF416 family)